MADRSNEQRVLNFAKSHGARLTGRELEVAAMMVLGMSNSEIAQTLEVTKRTASFHVSNVFAKFRVDGRVRLLVQWLRWRDQESAVPPR